jgi:hypothetical protein
MPMTDTTKSTTADAVKALAAAMSGLDQSITRSTASHLGYDPTVQADVLEVRDRAREVRAGIAAWWADRQGNGRTADPYLVLVTLAAVEQAVDGGHAAAVRDAATAAVARVETWVG